MELTLGIDGGGTQTRAVLVDGTGAIDNDELIQSTIVFYQRTGLSLVNLEPFEDRILGIVTSLVDFTVSRTTAVPRCGRRCKFDVKGLSAVAANSAATEATHQFGFCAIKEDHVIEGQLQFLDELVQC